jgi:hypothetical protein
MCVCFFVCYYCTEILYVFACMVHCKTICFIEWQLLCHFYPYVRSALCTNVHGHIFLSVHLKCFCRTVEDMVTCRAYDTRICSFLFCVLALYCSMYHRKVHMWFDCTFLLHWPISICYSVLNLCVCVSEWVSEWVREREREREIFGSVIFILLMLICKMIQKVFSTYS